MRIRNWVDLEPHGLALRLWQDPKGALFYMAVATPGDRSGPAALSVHGPALAAMGFRDQRGLAYTMLATFVRDRPTNQPELVDFQPGFPHAREVTFDRALHFLDGSRAKPRAEAGQPMPAELADVVAAVRDHAATGDDRDTLDRILRASVAFARSRGLDAETAFDEAAAPAPRM